MSERKIIQFDPDKFVLTKDDFLQILNNIGNRWSKNRKDNWRLLLEIEGAKLYFRMKSDQSIQQLWGEIIKEINSIMMENSLEIGKQNNESWVDTFNKLKTKKVSKHE